MSSENEISINPPKDFANLFLGDQNKTDFGDFTETLDRVLGKNRFDIFSSDTFEKCQKVQFDRKQNTPLFLFGGVFFIFSGIIIVFNGFTKIPNILIGAFFVIGGFALIKTGVMLNNKPSTDRYNKLTENSADPVIARIVIDWAKWLVASDIPLYLEKGTTSQEPAVAISNAYRKAANMVMVLLGDDRHRQALGVNERIPETPFRYKIEDSNRIFSPLIYELAKTPQYKKFRKAKRTSPVQSKNSSAEDSKNTSAEGSQNENESKRTQSTLEIVTQKKQLLEKTNSEKEPEVQNTTKDKTEKKPTGKNPTKKRATRTYPPRNDQYIKTILLNTDICKSVVEKMNDPKFYAQHIKGNGPRIGWFAALSMISKNPEAWEAFRVKPDSKENIKFKEELFGPKGLNSNNTSYQYNFRTGDNRYLNAFIKLTGVIATNQLIPKRTEIK